MQMKNAKQAEKRDSKKGIGFLTLIFLTRPNPKTNCVKDTNNIVLKMPKTYFAKKKLVFIFF